MYVLNCKVGPKHNYIIGIAYIVIVIDILIR